MSASVPAVHVIVLAFNGRDDVLRCLQWVLATDYPRLTVLLVDNASADDTVDAVTRRFPRCRILRNPRNLGFGAGCNEGIKQALDAGDDLVLLINPDTVASPAMVGQLTAFMREHPAAAIVGPKTLSTQPMPDGRAKLLYAGAWRRKLPLQQHVPGIERADEGEPAMPFQVDYVWGHAMMIRAAALRRIGLFDPAFFMYYEDLDLCRRVQAAGYELWCEPRAVIQHDTPDGARAIRSEPWRWDCKVHGMSVFYRKHYGRLAAMILLPLTVVSEVRDLYRASRAAAGRHLLSAYVRRLFAGGRRSLGTSGPPSAVRNGP